MVRDVLDLGLGLGLGLGESLEAGTGEELITSGHAPAALYSVGWGGGEVRGRGRAHLVREVRSLDGALALEQRRRSSSSAVRRHGGPNRGAGAGRGPLGRLEGAVQCGELIRDWVEVGV